MYQYPYAISPVMPAAYPTPPFYFTGQQQGQPNVYASQPMVYPMGQMVHPQYPQPQQQQQQQINSSQYAGRMFEDSLEAEQRKYESRKDKSHQQSQSSSLQPENIFSLAGNHQNNFHTRSMMEMTAEKEKKTQYAQILQQQQQIKKDLWLEKKQLETKHDLAMRIQQSYNVLPSYNRPTRDGLGNILQSRSTPGNRNYQQQDWFTHLPNIDTKYISDDDLATAATASQSSVFTNDHFRGGATGSTQSTIFAQPYAKQQPLQQLHPSNANNKSLVVHHPPSQMSMTLNNNHLSNYSQIPEDDMMRDLTSSTIQYEDTVDDEAEESRKVRILTPRKFRKTAKGTQTPHTKEELDGLTNMQISELYPARRDDIMVSAGGGGGDDTRTIMRSSSGRLLSRGDGGGGGGGGGVTSTVVSPIPNVKLTSYLTGEYKYANELEKTMKRHQYMDLQNQQIAQMEEKKRQKELARVQAQREKELEELRVLRERRQIAENEMLRGDFGKGKGSTFSTKIIIDDIDPRAYGKYMPKVRKRQEVYNSRPASPGIEDLTDTRDISRIRQVIVQEIPTRVSEIANRESDRLRNDVRFTENMLKGELNSMQDTIHRSNFDRAKAQSQMAEVSNEITVTRFIDEIRRREIEEKLRDKLDKRQKQTASETEAALLPNPGFAKYDLQNKKRIFFDYEDAYAPTQDKVNADINDIIRDDDAILKKSTNAYDYSNIRNKPNYVTFDDDHFDRSAKFIFSSQQSRIEQKLREMGLQTDGTQLQVKDNDLAQHDEIYTDIIRGNVANSKLLK